MEERRDAMLRGERINTSEDRAVLHTALRLPAQATLQVDGQDVVADVHRILTRMGDFCGRERWCLLRAVPSNLLALRVHAC